MLQTDEGRLAGKRDSLYSRGIGRMDTYEEESLASGSS